MLDKALNPELYAWEELQEEAARATHQEACDRAKAKGGRGPKKRAVRIGAHARTQHVQIFSSPRLRNFPFLQSLSPNPLSFSLSRIPTYVKVPRLNHAVRAFQFSKQEVERIVRTSHDKLTRREQSVPQSLH